MSFHELRTEKQTMSKSLKRTLSELNESNQDPPPKKMKLDNGLISVRSIFNDEADHQQFLNYFSLITDSELSQSLNIPNDISSEIAQFSAGTIKECEQCKIDFNILNGDFVNFKTKGIKKWSHCSKTDKFFCELCSKQTINFDCCGTVQCVKNYEKCTFIDDEEKGHCHNDDTNGVLMAYKCKFCSDDEEENCDCGKWHCQYHQDVMRAYCQECGDDACLEGSHLTCEKCWDSLCDRCFSNGCKSGTNEWKLCDVGVHVTLCGSCWDGVFCKGCNGDYCSYCYDTWQGIRAEREKHCKICSGYFCARYGCYTRLNKDDICEECVKKTN